MPPKVKHEIVKKAQPTVIRLPISDSSLVYVPEDAVEGFQERIETDIDWTLLEEGARHHKNLSKKEQIPTVTFSQALENKLNKSILNGFLNEKSGMSLEQHWEFFMPITLWDNEKFANDEGKIRFHNANCVTDDLVNLLKRTIKVGDRKVLKEDIKVVNLLRVNDSQMTELDEDLTSFKKLISLNLCGNYLTDLDSNCIPPSVKSLELQMNHISDVAGFAENLPFDLLYLGLARNFLTSDKIDGIGLLPYNLTVLDLSENDIYHLDPVLEALAKLPNVTALQLSGNPCSVSAGYARAILMKLTNLRWLDCREVLQTDRPSEPMEIHPDDLRAAYFNFNILRVMSVPQPPKPEKGTSTSFHIELEIPLLDKVRRSFLFFRSNESLLELLPPPEDEWPIIPSIPHLSKHDPTIEEASLDGTDIYARLVQKKSDVIHHYTIFESNRVQWNKLMNFQEPTIKIFCPDLVALRDTFRSVITLRLIYTSTYLASKAKPEKKSVQQVNPPGEMRVTLATVRCALRAPDWSQPAQHFHWDDSLGTNDAIHWGDGDLSAIQYSQTPVKTPKGKPEGPDSGARQLLPDNLTCHFGFGIDTLRVT